MSTWVFYNIILCYYLINCLQMTDNNMVILTCWYILGKSDIAYITVPQQESLKFYWLIIPDSFE